MSRETEAHSSHIKEHGCGDPTSPNFTGGTKHCDEAERLRELIADDDPDYPVVFG